MEAVTRIGVCKQAEEGAVNTTSRQMVQLADWSPFEAPHLDAHTLKTPNVDKRRNANDHL